MPTPLLKPEEFIVNTHYLYHPETGEILVSHRRLTLPGSPVPDEQRMESVLRRRAAAIVGRPVEHLMVLTISGSNTQAGAVLRVDVATKKLVIAPDARRFPAP